MIEIYVYELNDDLAQYQTEMEEQIYAVVMGWA